MRLVVMSNAKAAGYSFDKCPTVSLTHFDDVLALLAALSSLKRLKGEWSSPQVMRILERLEPFREEEAAA